MKFTLATLLLITAIAAVELGTVAWWSNSFFSYGGSRWLLALQSMAVSLPLWLPFVFVGYAIGRKQLTVWFTVTLVIAQLAAVGIAYAVVAVSWR
jgi:hypothetical protein